MNTTPTLITPYHSSDIVLEQLGDLPLYDSSKGSIRERHDFFQNNNIAVPSWIPSIRAFSQYVNQALSFYGKGNIERDITKLINDYVHSSSDFSENPPEDLPDADAITEDSYEVAYNWALKHIGFLQRESVIPFEKNSCVNSIREVNESLRYKVTLTDYKLSESRNVF